MDGKTEQKEFNRVVKQAIKKKARKRTLLWMVVIFFITIILSFAVHFLPIWYDMFVHYQDPVYSPAYIERQYKSMDKERHGGTKQ